MAFAARREASLARFRTLGYDPAPMLLAARASFLRHRVRRMALFILALFGFAAPSRAEDVGLRIRFGLHDRQPNGGSGKIEVSPGRVVGIDGWRFAGRDRASGSEWVAMTDRVARRSNRPGAKGGGGKMLDNGVLVSLASVDDSSRVDVTTSRGDFSFALSDVPF